MKAILGWFALVAVALVAHTSSAPAAQAPDSSNAVVAAQDPQSELGCPSSRPRCCEQENGVCTFCITRTQQCP